MSEASLGSIIKESLRDAGLVTQISKVQAILGNGHRA